MNLGELRQEVYAVCQEAGYATDIVDDYINEAIQDVAAQVAMPGLKRYDTVYSVLSQAYCTLSTLTGGFSGRLVKVYCSGEAVSKTYASLELLMDAYPTMTEAGDVEAVALEGSTLWYQKIPAVEALLTVVYYQNPSLLDLDEDEPSDFPSHLHRGLFVSGSAAIIFDKIEDGIEGEKVNTNSQLALQNRAISKLRNFVAARKKHYISSTWDY